MISRQNKTEKYIIYTYSPLELEWKDCNEKEDGPKNWEGYKGSPEDPHFNWRHSTLKTTLTSGKRMLWTNFSLNSITTAKINLMVIINLAKKI